jgi:hypothetical protein
MGAPFLLQPYISGAVPKAATANVAGCPTVTVCVAGCVVIEGDPLGVEAASVEAAAVFAPVTATQPVWAKSKTQARSRAKQAKGLVAVRSLGAFPCRRELAGWEIVRVIIVT